MHTWPNQYCSGRATRSLGGSFSIVTMHGHGEQLTHVVPHQVLHGFELGPRGDVVATHVQFPDLIMLYVILSLLVPITDGQGEGTCVGRVT